jgi:hypothetical protein
MIDFQIVKSNFSPILILMNVLYVTIGRVIINVDEWGNVLVDVIGRYLLVLHVVLEKCANVSANK